MKGTAPFWPDRTSAAESHEAKPREPFACLLIAKRKAMTTIVAVAIDLAKNVFAVHGVDEHRKTTLAPPAARNPLGVRPAGKLH